MLSSHSIHGVKSIAVRFAEAAQSRRPLSWIEIQITTDDGSYHELTLFVPGPIEIEGAEHVNQMARDPDSLVPLLRASIAAAQSKKEGTPA